MNDKNKNDDGKANDKNENNDKENKNEIKIELNNNQIKKDEEKMENKNEIIIEDETTKNENKEYFKNSFINFKAHFDHCESAIKNDIKNLKIKKNLQYNRDLLWQIFLGVLPYKSKEDWNKSISEERSTYHETKKKTIHKRNRRIYNN